MPPPPPPTQPLRDKSRRKAHHVPKEKPNGVEAGTLPVAQTALSATNRNAVASTNASPVSSGAASTPLPNAAHTQDSYHRSSPHHERQQSSTDGDGGDQHPIRGFARSPLALTAAASTPFSSAFVGGDGGSDPSLDTLHATLSGLRAENAVLRQRVAAATTAGADGASAAMNSHDANGHGYPVQLPGGDVSEENEIHNRAGNHAETVRLLRARVRRLEAALALEAAERDALERRVLAQDRVLQTLQLRLLYTSEEGIPHMNVAEMKAWESIVDAVAAMTSTEPLRSAYEATDYLPEGKHLSPGLVAALRAADANFAAQSAEVYQLQTTHEESFHATPTVPTFASMKNTSRRGDVQNDDEEVDEGTSRDGTSSGEPAVKRARTSRQDGRDFYARYRAASVAMTQEQALPASGSGGRSLRYGTSSSSISAGAATTMPSAALLARTSKLTSGFLDRSAYALLHRQPDFMPIILVPSTVTSPLQLVNIRSFLTEGMYIDPPTLFVDAQTGATNVQDTKPESVIVFPSGFIDDSHTRVAFRRFRVVDDPARVENWTHVCACVVNGKAWEFREWYPDEPDPRTTLPSHLFNRICGFLPYFEEDRIPSAVVEWNVNPLILTRRSTKTQQHITQVFRFWELLYAFLDQHPLFKLYDVHSDE